MVIRKPNIRIIRTEKRRLLILYTALTIFAQKGFAYTTVKDIADAADISIGSIYNHYRDKEQLLEAVTEQNDFLPQFRTLLKITKKQPYRKATRNIILGFSRILEERNKFFSIFLQESSSNIRVQNIWSNFVLECTALIQKYLSARIKTGELKHHDIEVSARCFFFVLTMLHFTKGIFKSSHITQSQFINKMLDNLLLGIKNTEL